MLPNLHDLENKYNYKFFNFSSILEKRKTDTYKSKKFCLLNLGDTRKNSITYFHLLSFFLSVWFSFYKRVLQKILWHTVTVTSSMCGALRCFSCPQKWARKRPVGQLKTKFSAQWPLMPMVHPLMELFWDQILTWTQSCYILHWF